MKKILIFAFLLFSISAFGQLDKSSGVLYFANKTALDTWGAPTTYGGEIAMTTDTREVYKWDGVSVWVKIVEITQGSGAPSGDPGTNSKLYTDTDTGNLYRWTGSAWSAFGAAGGATWGAITGTLSDQVDLQGELDAKADDSHSHLEVDITDLDHYDSADFDSDFTGKTTDDLTEGATNNYYPSADASKLSGIEAGATADQTAGEIKTLYESNADTNAFTDAEQSKLSGVESGATADQTAGEIKTAYESNANTNAFTDAEQSKLSGIESNATADQSDAEIETAYNNQVGVVSQGVAEAGVSTTVYRWTPLRVAQAIAALSGGGGGGTWGSITGTLSAQTDLQSALDGKAGTSHTHTESDITDLTHYDSGDFDTDLSTKTTTDINEGINLYYTEGRVNANTEVAANTAARHDAATIAAGLNYVSILGQEFTLSQIDLTIDVSGILPSGNIGSHTHTEANITDLTHFTGADITGSETAFTGWDKNAADDFDGDYNSLINQPTIPTNNNELINGAGYITSPNDGDFDPANEFQDLSYTASTGVVAITDGTNATIPVMTGATGIAAGEIGLVPKPLAGEEGLYLKGDGTYGNPSVGGDNWGSQVVVSDVSLTGNGTGGSPLAVDDTQISITESQISDFGTYLTGVAWGDITGTLSAQTDLQSALDGKSNTGHAHAAIDVTSGTFADARISQSSVTQHESALSITESQISDLSHTVDTDDQNAGEVDISDAGGYYTGTTVEAALQEAGSDIADNTADSHTHSNKATLDATTASFLIADETKLDGIEALADVTDVTNVTAAGALMDSEVDADLKTLSLPASTIISAFGATLVDDANASTARTTLGVDVAGTDNSTDVTLAGTPDYITIAGQTITRNQIDLATDVMGSLPSGNIGSHNHAASETTSGAFSDARISESSVTQHEGALSITESQISDLSHTVDTDTHLTQEQVEDYAGVLVNSGTNTLIDVTYNDAGGNVQFDVEADLSAYDNATSNFSTGAHYTDSDIDGTETAFDGWDKDASNDFDGVYSSLTGTPTIPAVSDVAYDATSWNGNTDGATKNAIRDKIEALPGGHSAVTLSGTPDYITLSGQDIIRGQVDLTTDVTGLLPGSNINTITESQISDLGTYLETEVDGSVSNEGSLTVAAGTSTTSVINSNTSGSTGVTLTAGTGLSIAEAGNVITLTNSQTSNATHTGDVTGSTALTIASTGITGKTLVTAAATDNILIADASSSYALRKIVISDLLARANHAGTQTASTISDFQSTVSSNTDVSANTTARHTHANSGVLDATTASFLIADESKLDGIEAGAEVNVQADWAAVSGDAFILNKPTVGTGDVVGPAFSNDNRVARFDLATGKLLKSSNVTLTDAGSFTGVEGISMSSNITMIASATVDGRDVSVDGSKLDGIEAGADVTDVTNVTAAGALMDSEVDADIQTLSLPASTTISAFGATLIDDAAASNARTTLGVDAAGTDNSTDVTLAGTPDYITIAGQTITRNQIDLTADVTGVLPQSNFNVTGNWTGTFDGLEGSVYLARANHTGTQTASTISDFQTTVSANSNVTANTAKVSNVSTSLSTGTVNTTTYGITSDGSSNDVVLASATGSLAGILTAAKFNEIGANTSKVTNATHTGEVTGSTALTVADNVIDEANLKLDEAGTNDYVLTYDNTKSGNMKWAAGSGGTAGVQEMFTAYNTSTSITVGATYADVTDFVASTTDAPYSFNAGTGVLTFDETSRYTVIIDMQANNPTNRLELGVRVMEDTGGGFAANSKLEWWNYAARDADQDDGGTIGTYIKDYTAGDDIKIQTVAIVDGGTTTIPTSRARITVIKMTGEKGATGATGAGTDDPDAFHDNEAGEIASLTSVTPASGDYILIEDVSDSNNKKKVTFGDFGSGGSSTLTAYKTADQSKTSTTTLADDADLTVTLEASSVYAFEMMLRADIAVTPDMDFAFTMPAGTAGSISPPGINSVTETDMSSEYNIKGGGNVTINSFIGQVETSTTAGAFTFKWAQNISDASATTVKKGSWIRLTKLN